MYKLNRIDESYSFSYVIIIAKDQTDQPKDDEIFIYPFHKVSISIFIVLCALLSRNIFGISFPEKKFRRPKSIRASKWRFGSSGYLN